MTTSKAKIGTTLFLGIRRDILIDTKQGRDIRFSKRDGFVVSQSVAGNFGDVQRLIDDYCKSEITSYIDRGISKLRSKKIKVTLPYTRSVNGVKETFDNEVEMNIDDYLDATGFSRRIDYEIGSYEREWGINAIDTRKKIFTLYFNLNLIKYDDGPHIEHVVAHELAHIFYRDHGNRFQDALRQLDPSSGWSQSFFNSGIRNVGAPSNSLLLIALFLGAIFVYWVYLYLAGIFGSISLSSPSF